MTAETIAPIPVAQTPRKTGLVRRILRNPVGLVAVLVLALMVLSPELSLALPRWLGML